MTGVVYEDQDSDGAYTSGEGMAGISIIAEESGEKSVTASAGGYGIPLAQGDHTIRAILADGREAVRQISVSDQNVKVDLTSDDFSFQTPRVTIEADTQAVSPGVPATLTWRAFGADSAVLDKGIGSVPPSGSVTVLPEIPTTYVVTVSGPAGDATASVTVGINSPLATISADTQTISSGESVTLTWTSEYADAVIISNGVGTVEANGSEVVTPAVTTTYVITASGFGVVSGIWILPGFRTIDSGIYNPICPDSGHYRIRRRCHSRRHGMGGRTAVSAERDPGCGADHH